MLLKKIVVAEDDDAIAHLVNMALGDAGFLCLRARDGAEAVSLVRVHVPDLLVLDVMMPRLSGLEVARKIKSDVILSRTPILMLTALTTVDNKVEGFEAGADDYLVKPFDIRELSARVHALIRASRRERDRNPITNLPGSSAMEDLVAAVIKGGREVSVLHFDVTEFDNFADQVGFGHTEAMVAELGQLVLECGRGRAAEFVGHLGGVDFIAVVARDQAESLAGEVIAAFRQKRPEWTKAIDASQKPGALLAPLEMKVAVVSTRDLQSEDELAGRLTITMRHSKQREGSGHVVWGPELA
ncbi:MAG TPA: response regulator [Kofleriaceae bacterium]|nr:response regulator [Kofleriaceae bacterium]